MAKLYERYTEETNGTSDALYFSGRYQFFQPIIVGNIGANQTHIITKLELKIEKVGTPTGNLVVEIRTLETDGKPTTTTLGSVNIDVSTIGTAGWYEITGFPAITLEASSKYAIVVSETGSYGDTDYIAWYGDVSANTDYPNGDAGYSTDDGATWTIGALGDNDFYNFRITGYYFLSAMVGYLDIESKAGENVNQDALSENVINAFLPMAVGQLNSRTRKNWEIIYESLSEDVRGIINEILSDLIAIKCINYDMSGYSSRLEAEDMKETLLNEAELLIEELKDRKVQEFIENA